MICPIPSPCFGQTDVDAEEPVFEWSDPEDRLGETTPYQPHRTQVDVVCRAQDSDGHCHVLFIEVKLTETDFGHCSAYSNKNNDTLAVCAESGPFGNNAHRCFQLRNHNGAHRRRYDQHLDPITVNPHTAGCSFRTSSNQPMRNIALANVLLDADEADFVHYTLCAPARHEAIWRRWGEVKALFDGGRVELNETHAAA